MSDSLKKATVLVTGGAGLIGSHIVDSLVDAGAGEIRVLDNLVRGRMDNLAEASARHPIKFIQGDVRDRATVADAVRGCDYVFHEAAIRITLCVERPRECIDVLVTGAFNIFEAAADAGVKKVVYASSASIYGPADVFPTNERHHPYNNRTLYGAAKLMNEGIACHFFDHRGLRSAGLRYWNVYGPRMDVTGAYTEVFVRWLDCIEKGQRPQMHGDGSTTMDVVYVGDVARANILAAQANQDFGAYNVAGGSETSLLDLWRAMQKLTGAQHLEPEFLPLRKVNLAARRLADISRARDELGFTAEVPLQEGLRRLHEWRRKALTKPAVA
jgi:nucleoside-diphosphate-sugar epimerase